jgi:DNA-binding CsgD family transcriptional regulator
MDANNPRIGTPPIQNFTRSDYNGGTQNWNVIQGENGLVYIGNNKGLLRYDGNHWDLVRMPNRTIVRSLVFDGEGRLYVGAQNELGYLEKGNFSTEQFVSLRNLVPAEYSNFADVWETFIHDEKVFFCTERAVFVYANDEMHSIRPPSGRFENFFLTNDQLLFQDKQEGLFKYSSSGLEKIFDHEQNLNRIIGVFKTTTHPQGIVLYEDAVIDLASGEELEIDKTGLREIIDDKPYCAIQLNNGELAIGTVKGGLYQLNQKYLINGRIKAGEGLLNNTVLCLYQDHQNNLWIGLDNGLSYAEISSPFRLIGTNMGLEGTGYASQLHNDTLYLATNQGLYFADWLSLKTTKEAIMQPMMGFEGQIWGMDIVDDRLIIDRHSGAYYIKNGTPDPISKVDGVWDFRKLKNYPGYAIEGTYTGFYVYRQSGKDWTLLGKLNGFDESARIFEEDTRGNIWVSHAYRGLYKIFLGNDPTQVDSVRLYGKSSGLPSDIFNNVAQIRGEIIFSTLGGVYTFDESTGLFHEHEILTGIIGKDKIVDRFLEDGLGNIWFSLEDQFGMIKVREEGIYNDVEVLYFNAIQDALVDGFEHINSFDKGNTLIGVEKGFLHYDPTIKTSSSFPFGLFLRSVSVSSVDTTLILNRADLDSQKTLQELDSDYNTINFRYIAPHFEELNRIEYKYFLDGFDEDWSDWIQKTEKEYTNLPAGNYTFRIKAKNAYGKESNVVEYAFRIAAPWYESQMAKVGYLIGFVLLLMGIYFFVNTKEKRKTEAFKTAQEEKLEKKEAEFQERVESRENEIIKLRNEKLRSEIAHKNSELASATMHLVQKGEILMKIKSDLQEVAKKAPTDLAQPLKRIERAIESDVRLDKNWERFESHFDQVHQNFFKRLRKNYPELTPKDQKLCAYLRMNLTTKEIAPLLNISVRGVEISRYRLRKKLNLEPDQNLVSFILEL